MSQGIHGDDLLLVSPLREWANISCWLSVGEIGPRMDSELGHLQTYRRCSIFQEKAIGDKHMIYFDLVACNCQSIIYRVRATMR
jgi:hypothetical protein